MGFFCYQREFKGNIGFKWFNKFLNTALLSFLTNTAQNFFSKFSLMENFIFCAV